MTNPDITGDSMVPTSRYGRWRRVCVSLPNKEREIHSLLSVFVPHNLIQAHTGTHTPK